MNSAVIVDAVRTPIAKASPEDGFFRDVRADDLSASLMTALINRTGIEPRLIEDVKWGCVQQQGEQGVDIARNAVLIAGLPVEVGGETINRNCASSLCALNNAAMSIMAGCEDIQFAGGVEHMHHVPMTKDYNPAPSMFRMNSSGIMYMGLTAEYLSMKYRINRQRQDEFALRSHQNTAASYAAGKFDSEIVPSMGRNPEGRKRPIAKDQCFRADSTIEALSRLSPAFNPAGGSVTAGNSSPLSVGASAVLMMSESRAKELGFRPLARVKAMAIAGVEPGEMGIGPVPAIHKALKRAGLKLEDIGAIEINEAFAVQVLSVLKLLGIDESRVNTRGGAIAIGHPLGASGTRIATTLLYRMRDEGVRYGLASLCIGQGQGAATIFESCN
ncbi:thiolase family protein [Schlesneria paludicola]|uniref:thiolase family protein n=1 Tax=Schlesneria paludicola TaxID=360056 RepID=UPI000492855D|nr:acetyl-CoA C-acyltransferase [Schlesneria paludicola]